MSSRSLLVKYVPRALRAVLVGVALAAGAASARAATYAEIGDAGALPATAQIVVGAPATALTNITGALTLSNGISEADLYTITLSSPSTFSATTTNFAPGKNNFDTQLFLFKTDGTGIAANDDDPNTGSETSTLPAGNSLYSTLPAGTYDLLITGSSQYPASTSGAIFPNFADANSSDATVVYGPTGPGGTNPFSTYSGNSNEGGNYSIALTGAQFVSVPEPATVVMAVAVAGLTTLRRRRVV